MEVIALTEKSIKKNYIYNVLYQLLTIITPLITTPHVSRKLGAEEIGIYSFTASIVAYLLWRRQWEQQDMDSERFHIVKTI